jgi:eukaryotic-like serine/threonine-protein kinase
VAIANGTRLGRYEIRAQLGAGGMGEVYRARDEKLNRDVAIKILPAAFSQDAERLLRFEQEAQAAGALNHPNILSIFDVATHDGLLYVVSELLDGETLREKLNGTALSQRRAIDYATQISKGLAAAHEKGIIHRDLKPENLFVTNDERIKILDFGLAKLVESAGDNEGQTDVPTRRVNTDPGAVMGTAGYISPEQVRGQKVDHRSDIFSLGAVLYEMLSGRRAFRGPSAVETLSAILKEDPGELSESNRNVSPTLERLVFHCLEKNPAARFHSANDLAFALEALSGSSVSAPAETSVLALGPARSKWREQLPWIVAAVAVLLAIIAFAVPYLRRAPAATPTIATRFFIHPPEKTTFGRRFAVSPDGRRVVFLVNSEGKSLLWVRGLDSLAAQPLGGTEEATYPFWSPDSRFVAFFSGGKLKKIEVTGGPAQTLCDAPESRGGTWNRDGVIVFPLRFSLYRVSAAGGGPTPLTTLDASRKETFHAHPWFLPDGRHFLYFANSAQRENAGIFIGSLDTRETKLLLNTNANAVYSPPGYLLFLRELTLMAQGFDASKLELTGDPFPVAEEVDRTTAAHFGLFSVSDTGVLVYGSGSAESRQLAWFDRNGKQLGTIGPPGAYHGPWLSPDEKRVVVSRDDPMVSTADIWLIELGRGLPTRFTFASVNISPIWSPDGSHIAFSTNRDGQMNLYQRAASGAGHDEALLKSDERKLPSDWSPDGKYILYENVDPKTHWANWDLWVLPLEGDKKPFPFLQTEFDEVQGQFSPDGKWIAYTSNESGARQVYVRSFPTSSDKLQVSTAGGAQPQWRRDGRELFYVSPDRKLMAVEVKGDGSTFEAGVPKSLFEPRIPGPGAFRNSYAVTADGQRFLVITVLEEMTPQPITVVMNWTADLKR